MTAQDLLGIVKEIEDMIKVQAQNDGSMACNMQKVYIALELVKTELSTTKPQ